MDVNFQFDPNSPKAEKTLAGFKAKYGIQNEPFDGVRLFTGAGDCRRN